MEENKTGRGGTRPNAGRPPLPNKRVLLSCRVSPATRGKLVAISKETGEGIGRVIDFIVEDYERIAEN